MAISALFLTDFVYYGTVNVYFKARNWRASLGCLVMADALWALSWEREGPRDAGQSALSAQAAMSLPPLTRLCLPGPDPNAPQYQWSASHLHEREGKVQGQ